MNIEQIRQQISQQLTTVAQHYSNSFDKHLSNIIADFAIMPLLAYYARITGETDAGSYYCYNMLVVAESAKQAAEIVSAHMFIHGVEEQAGSFFDIVPTVMLEERLQHKHANINTLGLTPQILHFDILSDASEPFYSFTTFFEEEWEEIVDQKIQPIHPDLEPALRALRQAALDNRKLYDMLCTPNAYQTLMTFLK